MTFGGRKVGVRKVPWVTEVTLKKADLFSIGKTQWALRVPLPEPPTQHSGLNYRTRRTGFWFQLTKNGNSFSYVKFQSCVNKASP